MAPSSIQRLTADDRREQILRSGDRLLAASPPTDWSVEEIARAAGISRGLLYRYFQDRETFLAASMQRACDQLLGTFPDDPSRPPAERLDVGLERFLDFAEDRAPGFVALFTRTNLPAVDAVVERTRETHTVTMLACLGDLLGIEQHRATTSPTLAAVAASHQRSLETVVTRWLERRELDRDQVRALVQGSLAGLLDGARRADPDLFAGVRRA